MIKVTAELISAVDGHREILGIMYIANDATGTQSTGNYWGKVWRKGEYLHLDHRTPMRTSEVKNYPRLRKPVWSLIKQMLEGMKF